MLKKGIKALNKAVVKDATNAQRNESQQIEAAVKAILESANARVAGHIQSWNEFILAHTSLADAQNIQQNCESFKTDLAIMAPLFSNQEPKGLKEIAWDIHECSEDRVGRDGAIRDCNAWLGAVRVLRDQFNAKHAELMQRVVVSEADLKNRQAVDSKLTQLSSKMSESRAAWGLLYDNTFKPINQMAVVVALDAFDERLAALKLATQDFDNLFTALDANVNSNIAARKMLESEIDKLAAAKAAADQERSISDLASLFIAAPPKMLFSDAANNAAAPLDKQQVDGEELDHFVEVDANEAKQQGDKLKIDMSI